MSKTRLPEYDSRERTVGEISELRAYELVCSQPFVVKVEPTSPGYWYDYDVYVPESAGFPFAIVRLEVKSSMDGIASFMSKIKDREGISLQEVSQWLIDQCVVVLNCGRTMTDEAVVASFWYQTRTLVCAHTQWEGSFDYIVESLPYM